MKRELLNSLKDAILKELADEIGFKYQFDPSKINESQYRNTVEQKFKVLLRRNRGINLTAEEEQEVLSEIIYEIFGLGPLEKLLKDDSVSEIMVNGPYEIFIEQEGRLTVTDITFRDEQHLNYIIEKIIGPAGRRISALEPYIDTRLPDGSRVNIVQPQLVHKGPVITIRKFSHRNFSIEELVKLSTLSQSAADFLTASVKSRVNILICGGASSGKTTLLNALGAFIPDEERVICIEDTRELHLDHIHTLYMETRPSNIEGKGEVGIRDILRNSLHMRPDRIIVGEVRSAEVLDMIQAMNTGHEGSMTTVHANDSIMAFDRLEVLMLMGSPNMTSEVVRRQIISAVDLIVHIERLKGQRRVVEISEVVKGREYKLENIFSLQPSGTLVSGEKAGQVYLKLKRKTGLILKEFENQ